MLEGIPLCLPIVGAWLMLGGIPVCIPMLGRIPVCLPIVGAWLMLGRISVCLPIVGAWLGLSRSADAETPIILKGGITPSHRGVSQANRMVWSLTLIAFSHLCCQSLRLYEKSTASAFEVSERTALLLAH